MLAHTLCGCALRGTEDIIQICRSRDRARESTRNFMDKERMGERQKNRERGKELDFKWSDNEERMHLIMYVC